MRKTFSKTLLVLCLLMSVFTSFSFAHFLDHPMYTHVGYGQDCEYYINLHSSKVVKNTPPYYTIKGDIYILNYADGRVLGSTYTFNYDYTQQKVDIHAKTTRFYNMQGRYIDDVTYAVNEYVNAQRPGTLNDIATLYFKHHFGIDFYH